MKITMEWLEEKEACEEGCEWFDSQTETDGLAVVKSLMTESVQNQVKDLYDEDSLGWANWLIVSLMDYKQYVSYAVFAAEQVIDIFEAKHPDDKFPREAIEAAKRCIDNPTIENKKVAYAAYAVVSATYSAYSAIYAAYAAYCANYVAAYVVAKVAANASGNKKDMLIKILNYGVSLLEGKDESSVD